jgi:ethanolamine ammonia-lyase large subunit
MQRRLTALGAMDANGRPRPGPETVARLYALYAAARGDRRSAESLADEGRTRVHTIRDRGFEVGFDPVKDGESSASRLEAIYEHARAALYASADEGVIRDACPAHLRVRTMAADRDDYLAHPSHGEALRADDRPRVAALARPDVQIVIADGLNANAINEQLRGVLLPLRRSLAESGCHVGAVDVVVRNGRVRAGYQVGALTGADLVVSFVGERPGTGLNTMSAYLTYGRDGAGRVRWDPGMDHACTTAVCGIHPKGKPPEAAAAEISRIVRQILDQRRSGVSLATG